ncbi:hypothetical protein AB0395_05050 [Streptosporangium sp. NPDC051023]|uniref:hypothetical protein n=1 Tax=Streptosporangium sp. NPDC051023 TaxID=3155410 RepID=UPI00344FDD09
MTAPKLEPGYNLVTYAQGQLQPIADEIGQDAEELAWTYVQAISAEPRITLQPREEGETETHKEYVLTLITGVHSLLVAVDTHPGDNWTADVAMTSTAFGHSLDPSSLRLSGAESEGTIHPSLVVHSADVTLGFYGPGLTFGVSGQSWYRTLGKHTQDFTFEDLFSLQ